MVPTAGVHKGEQIRVVIPQRTGALNQTVGTPTIRYVVKGVQSPVSTILRTASSTESLPFVKGTLVKMSDGKIVLKPIENQGMTGQQANPGTPIQIVSSLANTNPQSSSTTAQPTQNTSRLTFSPIGLTPKLTPSPLFPTSSGSRINPTISTSLNPGDIVRLQDSKTSAPPPVRLTLTFFSNKPLPFTNCTIQASTTVLNNKKLLVLSGLAGQLPPSVQQRIKDAVFRYQAGQLEHGKLQSTKFEIQLSTSINPNAGNLVSSPAPTSSPVAKENSVGMKSPLPVVTPQPVVIAAPQPVVVATPQPVAVASPQAITVATHQPVAVATPRPIAVAIPQPVAVATPKPVVVHIAPPPSSADEEVLPAQIIPDPTPEPVEEVPLMARPYFLFPSHLFHAS